MSEDGGVGLGHFLDHEPDTAVAVWCNRCQRAETYSVASAIKRLNERGLDGRAVGMQAFAGLERRRCPGCGAKDYDARPDRPQRHPGSGEESVPLATGSLPGHAQP